MKFLSRILKKVGSKNFSVKRHIQIIICKAKHRIIYVIKFYIRIVEQELWAIIRIQQLFTAKNNTNLSRSKTFWMEHTYKGKINIQNYLCGVGVGVIFLVIVCVLVCMCMSASVRVYVCVFMYLCACFCQQAYNSNMLFIVHNSVDKCKEFKWEKMIVNLISRLIG